jgi:hypothetical protein
MLRSSTIVRSLRRLLPAVATKSLPRPYQFGTSESDEKILIAETTVRLAQGTGQRPRGWLGPWFSQSRATPDLLREAGYEYLLD